MDRRDLILLQLELECIRLNSNGYLEPFQCDAPDEPARLYVYRDEHGYHRYLRWDVSPVLRQALKLIKEEKLFTEHELVKRSLAEDSPCHEVFRGKTYALAQESLANIPVDKEIFYEASFAGIEHDGKIIASCSSVRENGRAAEAWVQTDIAYRGRGLGRRVTLAWAKLMLERGKTPFYSHSVENIASQRLVEGLPFTWIFDIVSYS